jgi:broad specificity phosphatase PhoE
VLVLVRHGQSELNAAGRLSGRLDSPLTDLGMAQAKAVAASLAELGEPAAVISSPLRRARDTAAALGLPVAVDERWIELDYGPYDGELLADVPAEMWAAWRSDPSYAPPGGESLAAVGRRVRQACEELLGDPDRLTVVVSHVSPIKAAVVWALGVGDEVAWRMFLAPASITVIGPGPVGPSLHAFNVTAHLDGLAAA